MAVGAGPLWDGFGFGKLSAASNNAGPALIIATRDRTNAKRFIIIPHSGILSAAMTKIKKNYFLSVNPQLQADLVIARSNATKQSRFYESSSNEIASLRSQ
jgi:hypothetical protein